MEIRIFILGDSIIIVKGLHAILNECVEFSVVGSASSGPGLQDKIAHLVPHVILAESEFRHIDAIDFFSNIILNIPGSKILCIGTSTNNPNIVALLRTGVFGFLSIEDDLNLLTSGIRAVSNGAYWLSPGLSGSLVRNVVLESERYKSLTKREKGVLQLITTGKSNELISRTLSISKSTLKNHISSIYSKVGVKNRSELILWTNKTPR